MEFLKRVSFKVKMLAVGLAALLTGVFVVRRCQCSIPPPLDETKETQIRQDSVKQTEEFVKAVEAEAAARKQKAQDEADEAEELAAEQAKAEKKKLTKEAKNKPNQFSKKIEKELGLKKKTKREYKKRK